MFSPLFNVQVLEIILFFVYIRSIHNTLSQTVHSFIIHAMILTSKGGGCISTLILWRGGLPFHSSWGGESFFHSSWGRSSLPLILGMVIPSTHPEGDPSFHSSWRRSFLPLILKEILPSTHPGGGRTSLQLIMGEILPSTHPGRDPHFHSSWFHLSWGRSSLPLILG